MYWWLHHTKHLISGIYLVLPPCLAINNNQLMKKDIANVSIVNEKYIVNVSV